MRKYNNQSPSQLPHDLRGAVDALLLAAGWYPTTDADRVHQLALLRSQILAQQTPGPTSPRRAVKPHSKATQASALANELASKGLPVFLASRLQKPQ